jgi:hypothetical protein
MKKFGYLAWPSLIAISLMGCSSSDKGVVSVDGPTPVRYVLCGAGESNCFLAAKFKDMDGCHSHKERDEWRCDKRSRPGVVVCKDESDRTIAHGYCTL